MSNRGLDVRVGVLSDCRVPTRFVGGHGLGRVAHDIAYGLTQQGYLATLYCGPGSQAKCAMSIAHDETKRATTLDQGAADVWIDLSHLHDLSRLHPDWPVLNYMLDSECQYRPPNAAVATKHDTAQYGGVVIPMGVPVNEILFVEHDVLGANYLAFAAKIIWHKGVDAALEIHKKQPIPVEFVGERFDKAVELPNHVNERVGRDFYEWLGCARGLIQAGRVGIGGGRVQLEAAATGCPTLCFDGGSAMEHVEHCVSGFVCRDVAEMIDAVQDLPRLDRGKVREWVQSTHSVTNMLHQIRVSIEKILDGEVW